MSEINVEVLAEEEGAGVDAVADVLKGDKGDKGDQGIQGVPGYTPQKGTDYFTSEEIEGIKTDVKDDVIEEITPTLNNKANASDVYTKNQTDTLLGGKQNNITSFNKLLSDLVDDTNQTNKFVTSTEKTNWNAKYDKPNTGIPKTDLANDVQTSLGKADTALQEHQDISGKVDKVAGKGLSTEDYTTAEKEKLAELENYDDSELVEQIEALETELEETQTKLDRTRASLPKVSGEGENLTLNGTAEDDFRKFVVKGNTKQDSYTGKNLVPFTNQDFTLNNVHYYVKNGSLILDGTSTSETSSLNSKFKEQFRFTLPEGTYKISHKETDGACYLYNLNDTSSAITVVNKNILSDTFTLTEETEVYIGFYVYQNIFNNVNTELMIEEGSTATSYEPYVGGTASPNPDYPQEIKNVSGNVNVTVGNKNLIDYKMINANASLSNNGYYFLTFPTNATILNGKFKENTQYTLSTKGYGLNGSDSRKNGQFIFEYSDGTSSALTIKGANPKDFSLTSTSGKTISDIKLTWGSESGTYLKDLQLEEGTVATNYEPYTIKTFTFPLTQGQKLMEGDYLADDGVHHVRGQVDLADLTWNYQNDTYFRSSIVENIKGNTLNSKCKIARIIDMVSLIASTDNRYAVQVYQRLWFRCSQFETLLDWTNYLQEQSNNGNPVTVEYELAEEVIEPYTEAQQIVYNQIKKAISYKDQTNIYSTNEVSPTFKVTAYKDTSTELDNIKQAIVALGGVV